VRYGLRLGVRRFVIAKQSVIAAFVIVKRPVHASAVVMVSVPLCVAFVMVEDHLCVMCDVPYDVDSSLQDDKSDARRDVNRGDKRDTKHEHDVLKSDLNHCQRQ
jgi:hypothetical protein